jgi:hypothetical protein
MPHISDQIARDSCNSIFLINKMLHMWSLLEENMCFKEMCFQRLLVQKLVWLICTLVPSILYNESACSESLANSVV